MILLPFHNTKISKAADMIMVEQMKTVKSFEISMVGEFIGNFLIYITGPRRGKRKPFDGYVIPHRKSSFIVLTQER